MFSTVSTHFTKSHNAARYLSLCILLLCAAACGDSSALPQAMPTLDGAAPQVRRDAIMNGAPADEQDWPQVGALIGVQLFGQPDGICSGTLIAPDVVLTAGHCVASGSFAEYAAQDAKAQRLSFTHKPRAFPMGLASPVAVRFTAVHPAYEHERYKRFPLLMRFADDESEQALLDRVEAACGDREDVFRQQEFLRCISQMPADMLRGLGYYDHTLQMADIGLAFLATPIENVAPIRLPSEPLRPEIFQPLVIAGYGYHALDTWWTRSLAMRYAGQTRVASFGDYEIRIANDEASFAHGDSGGPALRVKKGIGVEVVGVISRCAMDQFGHLHGPCIATRVDAYRDWINEQMQAACAAGKRSFAACRAADE